MVLSEEAQGLYEAMVEDESHTYSQTELERLLEPGQRPQLVGLLQELMQQQQVKLLQEADGKLYYQAVSEKEAGLVRGMSSDEAMVYSYVQAAGREGIWTKTIRMRSGLHQHVVNRCLKTLETKRITKSIKSVKFPTRKIVMLYHLQPSIEVTGGPWFSDTELDSEFVTALLGLVWQYVASRTFPDSMHMPQPQASQLPGSEHYPGLEDVHKFVAESKVSTVELQESDIRSLCDVLVYDGKIEQLLDGQYRATWPSLLQHQGRYDAEAPRLAAPI